MDAPNDNSGQNPLTLGNEGVATTQQAGASVLHKLNKDGSPRQKPGRKPGVSYPRKEGDKTPSSPNVPTETVEPVDKETVRRSVQAVLKTFDGMICKRIFHWSMRLTASEQNGQTGDKAFAEGMAQDTAITPEELETIGELTAVVATKYSLLGKYAPELFLGVAVGAYGMRVYNTTTRLKDMLAEKVKIESRSSSNQSPSNRG